MVQLLYVIDFSCIFGQPDLVRFVLQDALMLFVQHLRKIYRCFRAEHGLFWRKCLLLDLTVKLNLGHKSIRKRESSLQKSMFYFMPVRFNLRQFHALFRYLHTKAHARARAHTHTDTHTHTQTHTRCTYVHMYMYKRVCHQGPVAGHAAFRT